MDYNWHIEFTGYSDPNKDRSELKDGAGRYRTNLFAEFNTRNHDKVPPMYTMREEAWKGLPSAYLIYMTSDSEYEAAQKLVGSWQHWQRLCKVKTFMEGTEDNLWSGLKAWREEKEIKDKAAAYNQLKFNAAMGNVTAQKIVFEGDKSSKRGRPSKEEVKRLAEEKAEFDRQIEDDRRRLRLVTENG